MKLIESWEHERLIAELKRRNARQVQMMELALAHIRAGWPERAEQILKGEVPA
jgi:hypothetical protein